MKMKPAVPVMITTTTTILVCALAGGLALAQSPSIIQNTRSTMNGVNSRATAASNEALGAPPAAANATGAATASGTAVFSRKSVSAQPVPPPRAGVAKRGPGAARRIVPGRIVEPKVGIVAPVANPKTHEKAIAAAVAAEGSENEAIEEPVVPDAKSNANGRRDPFISPVVSHATGSGCSTGKKCLEIGTVNLRGVVRSDSGFIAVVSNGVNKSYFLRENDPVFNGYVTKITGDSIVFKETLQDRMGKSFTREVVKKITIPAV